jgi:plastocyanin
MDDLIASLLTVWAALLDLMAQILLPNWNDVLKWIPALLLGLVGLTVALLVVVWLRNRRVMTSRMIPIRREPPSPPGVHLPGPSRWPFIIPLGLGFVFAALVFHPGQVSGSAEPAPTITDLINLPLMLIGLAIVTAGAIGWYLDAGREWRRVEAAASHATSPTPTWAEGQPRATLPPGVHLPGPSPWPFLAPLGLGVLFSGLVFNPVFILAGLLMTIIAAGGWYRDAGREYRSVEAGHPLDGSQVDPVSRLPSALLGIYATIGVVAVVIAAFPSFVAWANPAPTEAPAASLSPNQTVVAEGVLGFAQTTMTVPAGVELTIDFQNPDTGVQHNWALYDPADGAELFKGEIITGPGNATYTVPALEAGTYDYVCDIHPQTMTGTLTAQ